MRKKKDYTIQDQEKLKKIIQERTGYLIRSDKLLEQIFTRSTYSAQKGGENNEVLEFIGDQVLSYFLVKKLSRYCGDWSEDGEYIFRLREHHLTTIKQKFVCNETLCEIVDSWGVAKYVIAGPKDWPNGLNDQPKARADLFEAILGAIALESGWDDVILERAVNKMLSLDKRLAAIMLENSL